MAAFVSGGAIPVALRGTSNAINFHIVDWCTCLWQLPNCDCFCTACCELSLLLFSLLLLLLLRRCMAAVSVCRPDILFFGGS